MKTKVFAMLIICLLFTGCTTAPEPKPENQEQNIYTDTLAIEFFEKHTVEITDKIDGNKKYRYHTVRMPKAPENRKIKVIDGKNLLIEPYGRYLYVTDKKNKILYTIRP